MMITNLVIKFKIVVLHKLQVYDQSLGSLERHGGGTPTNADIFKVLRSTPGASGSERSASTNRNSRSLIASGSRVRCGKSLGLLGSSGGSEASERDRSTRTSARSVEISGVNHEQTKRDV